MFCWECNSLLPGHVLHIIGSWFCVPLFHVHLDGSPWAFGFVVFSVVHRGYKGWVMTITKMPGPNLTRNPQGDNRYCICILYILYSMYTVYILQYVYSIYIWIWVVIHGSDFLGSFPDCCQFPGSDLYLFEVLQNAVPWMMDVMRSVSVPCRRLRRSTESAPSWAMCNTVSRWERLAARWMMVPCKCSTLSWDEASS